MACLLLVDGDKPLHIDAGLRESAAHLLALGGEQPRQQPLAQVATAALNPSDIAAPIRSILRKQRNTRVILGDVIAIARAGRAGS